MGRAATHISETEKMTVETSVAIISLFVTQNIGYFIKRYTCTINVPLQNLKC